MFCKMLCKSSSFFLSFYFTQRCKGDKLARVHVFLFGVHGTQGRISVTINPFLSSFNGFECGMLNISHFCVETMGLTGNAVFAGTGSLHSLSQLFTTMCRLSG